MADLTFLDAIEQSLRRAADHNPDDQVAPVAVLWSDGERQWESLLPALRQRLPILTLGPYDPATRTGPAIFLRCMVDRTLPEDVLPVDAVPILYLPGYSRLDLRTIVDGPVPLQPLLALQYRGAVWAHANGRDWTIAGYLQNSQFGLGVSVAGDSATREALPRALTALARESVESILEHAPVREAYLNELLNPDLVKRLLLWMDDPEGYRTQTDGNAWDAFCRLCQKEYGFHPEKDGDLTAGLLLGTQTNPWDAVWQRYIEAPRSYAHIPDLLRRAKPAQPTLFEKASPYWPQDNEAAESDLRSALLELDGKTASEVTSALHQLEKVHGYRRSWVWRQLDRAPLAAALLPLSRLADLAQTPISEGSLQQVATDYTERGWRVDATAVEALSHVTTSEDYAALRAPITALYRPWLEKAALTLQHAVLGNIEQDYRPTPIAHPQAGTCVLFCDALRLDLAQALSSLLADMGCQSTLDWRLAALPPITSTAKPAIILEQDTLTGGGYDLVPRTQKGTPVNAGSFRDLLRERSYQVLVDYATGDPGGIAWTEMGALDQYGHGHGWRIIHQVAGELDMLARRIKALLDAGWKQVVIVTDHGWLLLPGGLPKCELPEHLTYLRKGRCALLKEGAQTDQDVVPWHWDHGQRVAMAPGIACYEAGKEYEHGALSPQECIVPVITVRSGAAATPSVTIASAYWTGLRCRIVLAGTASGLSVDIRTKAGDASTSVVARPGCPDEAGNASVIVADDTLEGTAAIVVVVDDDGALCAQLHTTIGE
ncbi:MAG: BREX-1 system phosphatase PglZ type B [Anaerolineales bacterium]|nr:BREX-1 system phosphatase PglZ type B [Anaerolineales bacterium]